MRRWTSIASLCLLLGACTLFQPAVPYAYRSDLSGVTFNSVWGVDLFAVSRSA